MRDRVTIEDISGAELSELSGVLMSSSLPGHGNVSLNLTVSSDEDITPDEKYIAVVKLAISIINPDEDEQDIIYQGETAYRVYIKINPDDFSDKEKWGSSIIELFWGNLRSRTEEHARMLGIKDMNIPFSLTSIEVSKNSE